MFSARVIIRACLMTRGLVLVLTKSERRIAKGNIDYYYKTDHTHTKAKYVEWASCFERKMCTIKKMAKVHLGHIMCWQCGQIDCWAVNAVWLDYNIEATEHKALKGSGAYLVCPSKVFALTGMRWFMARHMTSQYAVKFRTNVVIPADHAHHLGHHTVIAVQKRWDTDVVNIVDLFETTFINPFDLTDTPN